MVEVEDDNSISKKTISQVIEVSIEPRLEGTVIREKSSKKERDNKYWLIASTFVSFPLPPPTF